MFATTREFDTRCSNFCFSFFFWLEEVRVSGYIRQPVGAKKGASLDAEVSTWRFEISELD